MIGGSERSAVLVVSGLVVGVYQFTLTVTNRNNLSASDTAIVTVFPSPFLNYTLQLELQLSQQNSTNSFTMADQVRPHNQQVHRHSQQTEVLPLCDRQLFMFVSTGQIAAGAGSDAE